MNPHITITDLTVQDIRFPRSQESDGSDVVYVTLHTSDPTLKGYAFTCTTGNELCIAAIHAAEHWVVGKKLSALTEQMGTLWRQITAGNLRLDKGITHQAAAAIMNAVWDLWARREQKPLWRLIVDMSPEELLHCLDFSIIDAISPDEAQQLLQKNAMTRGGRIAHLLAAGYPAKTRSICEPHHQVVTCVNEILAILLISAKCNVSARGMGLCEYVQHLAIVDYIYISGSLENRVLGYVDHLHEHFEYPVEIKNGCYQVPTAPGYSIEMKESSLARYHFPEGQAWQTQ